MSLPGFVTSLIEHTGGVVEPHIDGFQTVLLPEELRRDAHEMVRLTFDPEVARERPDIQMITYGSALLEQWIGFARGRGRTCRVFVQGVPIHAKAIPSPVGVLTVAECDVEIDRGIPKRFETPIFSFGVGFLSDERVQERRAIAVEPMQGRIERRLIARLETATLSETSDTEGLERATGIDARRCYRIARKELENGIVAEMNTRKHALRTRCADEQGKISRYFEQIQAELTEELHRAGGDAETSGRLLGKIAATRAEQKRQLAQVESKYDLSVQVSLSSVLQVCYPKFVFVHRLRTSWGEPVEIPVVWDPFQGSWVPPSCPACDRPTTTLRAVGRGVISCPLCPEDPGPTVPPPR